MKPGRLPLRPIFLLTDFGLEDWYVGAMKAEIHRRAPDATIIDLSHGVPPQNVAAGAFVLNAALNSVPSDAVLCCVVDPGVGSHRRAIWGRIGTHYFSGPDNGLATPLLERASDFELFEIPAPLLTPEEPSLTFQGRDLFAPAAALLAEGYPFHLGPPVADPVRLSLDPEETADGIRARVMLVDRFGNLITNIWREKYEAKFDQPFEIQAGPLRITQISKTFSNVPAGSPLAYWGSAGTLEIGINMGSAAEIAGKISIIDVVFK
ncbi:SAM-dependent chlorinase/fluorinase [bacterium]|nr:SAM-dependent chlorinase/fluorinase [bacterium]